MIWEKSKDVYRSGKYYTFQAGLGYWGLYGPCNKTGSRLLGVFRSREEVTEYVNGESLDKSEDSKGRSF